MLDIADSCEAVGAADVDDSEEAVVLDSDDDNDVATFSGSSISGSACKQWRSGYIRRGGYAVCGPTLGDLAAVKTSDKLRSFVHHSIHSDLFSEKQHGYVDEFLSEREVVDSVPIQDSLGCNRYTNQLGNKTKNIQGLKPLSTRKMVDENHSPGNKCEAFDVVKGSTTCSGVDKKPVKLGQNESQESEDLAQADALGFVDHYLSLNSANFLEKDTRGKTCRLKSPPSSRAKGLQNLARRTTNGTSCDLSRAFDWNDDRVHEVEEHVFRSKDINAKLDRLKSYVSKLPNNLELHREKTCTEFSKPGLESYRVVDEVDQVSKMNFAKELDDEKRPEQIEAGDNRGGVADACDIGFDTQMAAEAIQSLFYAPPSNCMVNHHQDPGNIVGNSSAGKEAHSNSGVALRNFKTKSQNSKELKGKRSSFSEMITKDLDSEHGQISTRRKKRNWSSIAYRTWHSSTVQPLDETKYQLNCSERGMDYDVELGVPKRRKNYKNDEVLQLSTVRRKRSNTSFLVSEKVENLKVSKKQQKNVNLASDCCHLMSGIWSFPKGKRKHRKARHKLNGLSFFQNFPSVQGETGPSPSVRCPKTPKENSGSSCSKVYVRRKSHSPVQDHQVQSTVLLNFEECSLKQNLEVQSSTNALHGNVSGSDEKMTVPSDGQIGNRSSIRCPENSEENSRSSCLKVFMRRNSSPLVQSSVNQQNSEVQSSANILHGSFSFTDEKVTVPGDTNFESSRICGSMESVGATSPATGAYPLSEKPQNANASLNGAEKQHRLDDRRCTRVPLVKEISRLEISDLNLTNESKYSRRRRDMKSVKVLFSQNMDATIVKKQKKILGRLGSSIASSSSEATHFVADRFVRTRNMLEAIALGKPVVTHLWLSSCRQANSFVNEKNFILRDAKKEQEIGFSMPVSLANASKAPLFKGKRVFVTPNIKPGKELIVSLVKAAQGEVLSNTKDRFHESVENEMISGDLFILSCEEDYALCAPLLEQGAAIYSSELLLNGIIVQKLEFERHRLFKNRF